MNQDFLTQLICQNFFNNSVFQILHIVFSVGRTNTQMWSFSMWGHAFFSVNNTVQDIIELPITKITFLLFKSGEVIREVH